MVEKGFLQKVDEDLFSIAIEEYLNFRYTDKYPGDWEESYKYEILESLNDELSLGDVDQDTIVEVVETLQSSNPQSGSFVHWSNLDDLKTFAGEEPETVSSQFHNLFDEDKPLENRISTFREKGRDYDPDINLGTPLFGYVLAAFDRKKYTVYKDGPFRDTADWFDFEVNSGVSSKYQSYLELCSEIRNHFNKNDILRNRTATPLDAQDFIFSISVYDGLRLKIALKFLSNFSEKLAVYKEDPDDFLEEIKNMNEGYLRVKRKKYKDSQKVKKIRYEILDAILEDTDSVNLDTVKNIMERVNEDSDKDILHSWDEFKILFELYFSNYKNTVNTLLGNIHDIIREELEEEEFTPDEVINDFSWNQNFGSTRAGIVLFPNRNKSYRDSAQLLLDFIGGKVRYGLYFGDNVETEKEKKLEEENNLDDLFLKDVVDKFKSVLPGYREVNKKYWKISPGKNAYKWDAFRDGGYIAIGWDEIDYPEKKIREEIEKKGLSFDTKYVEDQFEYFVEKMKQGDIVLAYGSKTILGVGKIESGYYKEESADDFPHRRDVSWFSVSEFPAEDLGEDFYDRVSKNQTIVPIENDEFVEKVQNKMKNKTYFWLTTDTKDLGLAEKTAGDKITFSTTHPEGSERRVIEDIQKVKKGDKIIGYHTGKKEPGVWCVLEVKKRFEENDEELIEMQVSEKFDTPAQKSEIVKSNKNSLKEDSLHGKRVFEITGRDFRDIVEIARNENSDNQSKGYFWVTANPKIWTVDDLEEQGEIFYAARNKKLNKRRVYGAFESATQGDKVIFYESTPTKYTKAIGEVRQGLHPEQEEGYEEPVEGITIGFDRNMEPITWKELSGIEELEDSYPISNSAQGSLFELTEAEYDAILALEPDVTKQREEIPTVNLLNSVEFNKLYFPPREAARLKSQISSAIENGKYIILIGPPGTGKSKLAKEICSSYVEDNYQMVTANSDWSTFDTIGGYHPEKEGSLQFQPGIFLESFKDNATNELKNKWLILDEINRADIDKAFGALFSALTGDEISLSFKADNGKSIIVRPQEDGEETVKPTDHEHIIPEDWRLIATMNTYDKTSLYEMSYAFMRRFAFIPVPAPKEERIDQSLVEKYLDIWDIDDNKFAQPVADLWQVINRFRKVGPATIEDIYKTLLKTANGTSKTNLDYSSALIMHVFPQFEGLLEDDIVEFINKINGELSSDIEKFDEDDMQEISDFSAEYFQINKKKLPTPTEEEESE